MNNRFTAQQRVERARVRLLRDQKWQHLAGLIMLGKTLVVDSYPGVQTAATDGRDVFYINDYVQSITDAELEGVVLHETFHIMFKHLSVWNRLFQEDANLAGQAADYVINNTLVEEGVTLPDGVLIDAQYKGMDTYRVFQELKKQGKGGKPGVGKPGAGKPGAGDPGASHDQHMWEEAQALSDKEREVLVKDIDRALREGQILAGRNKGEKDRLISELLAPKVDWREATREFISTTTKGDSYATWRRPARRHLHAGLYLPSLISERMGHLVLAADTSGSIDNKVMTAWISEGDSICKTAPPEMVDLLYWDAGIAGHEHYEGEAISTFVEQTKPKGGGGTDVRSVFKFIAKQGWHPQCVVILTDGYTPWPDTAPPYPVLWGITTDVVAPFGVTLKIDMED